MKLSILLALFMATSMQSIAQNDSSFIPNYDEIEEAINDVDGPLYYPLLVELFTETDSILSLEQCHHLYYGAVLQDDYSGYATLPSEELPEEVEDLLEREELNSEEYEEFKEEMDELIQEEPLDMMLYIIYGNVAFNQGDSATAGIKFNRFYALVEVLESSGTGLSKEDAIHVIKVKDEYVLLNLYGFKLQVQSLIDSRFDKMELQENEYEVETLWFDVSAPFSSLSF